MTLKDRLKDSAFAREAVRQVRLRRGHQRWDRVAAQLADASAVSSSDERVLFATVGGGYLAGSRVESLLALALAARGVGADVLLCDGVMPACLECNSDWYPDHEAFARRGPRRIHCDACFRPAEHMFRGAGVRVYRYSDLLDSDDLRDADELSHALSIADIADHVADGVAIGEHALAGALRYFARGSLPDDAVGEAVLRRYFAAAILTHRATNRLLNEASYTAAVFHHGIYVPQGIVGEVARRRGVRVVNWHVAYRKSSFIFSHGDTYHHTLIDEPTSAWEDMAWSAEHERRIVEYLNSRWYGTDDWIVFHAPPELDVGAIEAATGVDFTKPCVGMLTNVLWDAQLHYRTNAFPNLMAWAEHTVEYFRARPDIQLLIRVHPAELSGTLRSREPFLAALHERVGSLPSNVFVIPPESNLSTYAAMSRSDSVLIYGTKTGVELVAQGIPVIVAGEAWIRNKGLTTDVESPAHYTALLDELPLARRLPPEVVERARRYAFHFFFRRMIPLEFARPREGAQGGFQFEVDNVGELRPGHSVGLDVICDGILHGSPFIYPAERDAVLVE